MTLTPQSLASLSKCKAFHRVPNIGPMKRMAGRLTLSKFVVVENVTLSFEWFAVPGSHRARWKCLVHIMRIAWSSGEKDVIAEEIHDAGKKRKWAELGREQNTAFSYYVDSRYLPQYSVADGRSLTLTLSLTLSLTLTLNDLISTHIKNF